MKVTRRPRRSQRRRNRSDGVESQTFVGIPRCTTNFCGGREIPAVLCDEALDRSGLTKPLHLSAGHARISVAPGVVLERELHHPIGADVRKRIDQDAIDDAEDGAGRADPERQRKNCGQREPGAAAKFARGEAQVGEDRAHTDTWTSKVR